MKIEERRDEHGNRWYGYGGMFHREDGPAIIYKGGGEVWYLNNRHYFKLEDMPLKLFLAYVKWELKKHGK